MTDIQRDGSTENQRSGDSEKRSFRDGEDTDVTEDVPRLAASVGTLQDAVQLSFHHGINENSSFTFARALKAFEITTHRRLSSVDLDRAFSLWWNMAKQQLPDDADYDEYRLDFLDKFDATKSALGSNSLEEAVRRARAGPLPAQALRYNSAKIRLLVAVCYHLQVLQGASPFFLSSRDAAKVTGAKSHWDTTGWLSGLVRDGVLIEVKKGTRVRATRFRFNAPEFVPAAEVDSAHSADADAGVSKIQEKKLSAVAAKSSSTPSTKEPTGYELAEKKKAIRELLAEFGDPKEMRTWEPAKKAEYKRLSAALKLCNEKLANLG